MQGQIGKSKCEGGGGRYLLRQEIGAHTAAGMKQLLVAVHMVGHIVLLRQAGVADGLLAVPASQAVCSWAEPIRISAKGAGIATRICKGLTTLLQHDPLITQPPF